MLTIDRKPRRHWSVEAVLVFCSFTCRYERFFLSCLNWTRSFSTGRRLQFLIGVKHKLSISRRNSCLWQASVRHPNAFQLSGDPSLSAVYRAGPPIHPLPTPFLLPPCHLGRRAPTWTPSPKVAVVVPHGRSKRAFKKPKTFDLSLFLFCTLSGFLTLWSLFVPDVRSEWISAYVGFNANKSVDKKCFSTVASFIITWNVAFFVYLFIFKKGDFELF